MTFDEWKATGTNWALIDVESNAREIWNAAQAAIQMETEIKRNYEERTRHLETPEFVAWFETWYAKESEYGNNKTLRDQYLIERNFALTGWLAAKADAHKMSKIEFVTKVLPMKGRR